MNSRYLAGLGLMEARILHWIFLVYDHNSVVRPGALSSHQSRECTLEKSACLVF